MLVRVCLPVDIPEDEKRRQITRKKRVAQLQESSMLIPGP